MADEFAAGVVVEGCEATARLASQLAALIFGKDGRRVEVAVTCHPSHAPAIERLLKSRFQTARLFCLSEGPGTGALRDIVESFRAPWVVFSSASCEPWSWGDQEAPSPDACAYPLIGSVPSYALCGQEGTRGAVPWLLPRAQAAQLVQNAASFEDISGALLTSVPDLAWSSVSGPWRRNLRRVEAGARVAPGRDAAERVGCAIPFFGCERWLDRCLASIMAQTRPLDWVAVVADGGVLPPSDVMAKYPDVAVFLSDERVGPFALVQAAIDASDCDWYLFQDADDWSSIDRLERLIECAHETGAGLVGSQEVRVFEDDGTVMPATYPLDASSALRRNFGHALLHPTSLVARDLLSRIGGFSTGYKFGADTEFLFRAAFGGKIANVDAACYYRRHWQGSLTTDPVTALGNPMRQAIAATAVARARENVQRLTNGETADLRPALLRDPIRLRYVSGPARASNRTTRTA